SRSLGGADAARVPTKRSGDRVTVPAGAGTNSRSGDQMNVVDPLRHYKHYTDSKHGPSPYAGGSSFMERVSEAVASGMGTVGFLIVSSGVIVAWVLANHVVHFLSSSWTGLL